MGETIVDSQYMLDVSVIESSSCLLYTSDAADE